MCDRLLNRELQSRCGLIRLAWINLWKESSTWTAYVGISVSVVQCQDYSTGKPAQNGGKMRSINTIAGWMSAFYYRIMGKRMERTPGGLGDDRNNEENVIISSESYMPPLHVSGIQQSLAGLWGKVEISTPPVSEEREYRLNKLAKPAHQAPGLIFEMQCWQLHTTSLQKSFLVAWLLRIH